MKALLPLLLATGALAAGFRYAPSGSVLAAYRAERLVELQTEGRLVALQFYSEGSQVCLDQEKVLQRLSRNKDDTLPVFLQVDVLAEESLRQRYSAVPSALLLFRGTELIGMKNSLHTEDAIRTFIREAVERSRGRPRRRPKRTYPPKR